MAILHGLRSIRFAFKGFLLRRRICPDPNHPPLMLTNRVYIGLRLCDLFGHVNNARYIELFEFARWEVFQASGFGAKARKAKIFPVVASVHVNFYREMLPFQIATIQTGTLGTTAKGNQMILVQHIYDSKKRLCATGIFHVPLLDWNTNKPMPVRQALSRMGIETKDGFLLQRDELDRNNVDISVENLDLYKKACADFGGLHLSGSGYFPKIDQHSSTHPVALEANVVACAYLTEASGVQRRWLRGSDAEGKSTTKKK